MVVPEPEIGVREGAIAPWNLMHSGWYLTMVESLAQHDGVDLDCAWRDLPPAFRQRVSMGQDEKRSPWSSNDGVGWFGSRRDLKGDPKPQAPFERDAERKCA